MKRPATSNSVIGASKSIAASALSVALVLGMSPSVALATDANQPSNNTPGASAPNSGQGGSSDQPTPPGDNGQGNNQGGQGQTQPSEGDGAGGSQDGGSSYSGTYSGVLSANASTVSSNSGIFDSVTKDQNVVLAQNGGTATVAEATITKSGDDSDGDTCNFYGVNSSVVAVGSGSAVNISDSTISSTGEGCNGLFATDSGAINANNVKITTETGGNSRGLDATYGGTIIGNLLAISTAKDHCASIATDRGGGYVSCTNSILATAGSGSPLLYSTGDIEVDNVSGTATGSQIAGMEGLSIIRINNSTLESTNDAISGSDPIKDGVIIYQSTSGDADTSTSSGADFEASDSTLKTSISSGAFFYTTNTAGNITLKNTSLDFDSSAVELLHSSGNTSNNWGTSGSNGSKIVLTGIDQTLKGNVYVDAISSAELYLTDGSTWTGVIADTNTSGDGTTATPSNAIVNVDASSTWVVTDSCTVGTLNVAEGGKVVDSEGKTVSIVCGESTIVSGDSTLTVTVAGTYSTTLGSNAGSISGASSTLESMRASFDTLYGTSTAWGTNTGAQGYDAASTDDDETDDDESTDAITAFASRLYTKVLDRTPDESGLADQVAALKDGTAPAEIAYNFFNSDEYQSLNETHTQTVERVYRTMFGREADEDGLAFWVNYLDSGMSLRAVVAGFSQSDEYKAYFSSMSVNNDTIEVSEARDINIGVTGFANRLYSLVLDRTPDVKGLNVQCNALLEGTSCSQIAWNFFNSEEFINNNHSESEQVRICYRTLLDRECESDSSLNYWVKRLHNEGMQSIVGGFCESDEFAAICAEYGMTAK